MQAKMKKPEDKETKRPQIIPPPLCGHLKLVHCVITEEERFQARIRKWDKRRKLSRMDFY